jgi:hypothetical protein
MTKTTADFVESVTERIQRKIDKCRNELRESHDVIQDDKLIIEIDRLDWILAQVNNIKNRESNIENMMKQKLF